jgi:hypothetical protein
MKLLWIFLLLLAAVIAASFLGNMVENFAVATDTSGNSTNYITHSQAGTSTFSSTTDPTTGATTYDNYNHYDGVSSGTGQLINGAVYYGPNGGRATVIAGPNGGMAIRIVFPNDPTPIVYNSVTVNTWQGPNGTATLAQSTDGTAALKVTLNNGTTYIYTINPASSGGGSGGTGTTTSTDTANYDTTYYASTGSPPPPNPYAYDQPPPPPPAPTPAPPLGSSDGGIPRSMIPPGQEDLYVLKTSIVPPVCPACPAVIAGPGTCPAPPPCPPCARCPEPQFDCKKVPNYSAVNNTSLPLPVLNSFAGFGL